MANLFEASLAASSIFEGGFPSEEALVLTDLIQMSVYHFMKSCRNASLR